MRPNLTRSILFARIYMPWSNLGCLAVRHGAFYADVFARPYFGAYVHRTDGTRTYYHLDFWRHWHPFGRGWWRFSNLRRALAQPRQLYTEMGTGAYIAYHDAPWRRDHQMSGPSLWYLHRQAAWGCVCFWARSLWCDLVGHLYQSDDWAGPNSGGIGWHCDRCGDSHREVLY